MIRVHASKADQSINNPPSKLFTRANKRLYTCLSARAGDGCSLSFTPISKHVGSGPIFHH